MNKFLGAIVAGGVLLGMQTNAAEYTVAGFDKDPFKFQIDAHLTQLQSSKSADREAGIENLSSMRAFESADKVSLLLKDPNALVRREAAMNLGWTGNRNSLKPLVEALSDDDWTVSQAASVSLQNLTAKKLKFDALAKDGVRNEQIATWTSFVEGFNPEMLTQELGKNQTANNSSKTKLFEAEEAEIKGAKLTSNQAGYSGKGFVDYAKSSGESISWDVIRDSAESWTLSFRYALQNGNRPLKLSVNGTVVKESFDFNGTGSFKKWKWVSITTELKQGKNIIELTSIGKSGGNVDCLAVTKTEAELETVLNSMKPASIKLIKAIKPTVDHFRLADVIRAIGFMQEKSAEPIIISLLKPYLKKEVDKEWQKGSTIMSTRSEKHFVQACIRTLGRLGGDDSKKLLIQLLDALQWAHYAADALGDIGGEDVASALIKAYPDYAFKINVRVEKHSVYNGLVEKFHYTDRAHLESDDRIPRVSHMILQSLCRIEFDSEKNIEALADIAPNILATFPTMFDATVVYKLEPHQMFAAHLLEKCGLRQAAVNAAFIALKKGSRTIDNSIKQKKLLLEVADDDVNAKKSTKMPYAGTILMALCRDKADIPLIIELLEHTNGWIKIDAARTLLYMEAQEAIPALTKLLTEAKDDADYGYDMNLHRFWQNGKKNVKGWVFKPGAGYDEYSDPSPRHKQAFIMALGGLKALDTDELLIKYLNNQRNVCEIQYAAAKALYQLATPKALEALRVAEARHPFETVRQVAREAVWHYELKKMSEASSPKTRKLKQLPVPQGKPAEIVFIKGVMDPGNNEQHSSDKTGYGTTDGGPTYRLGNNIFKCKTADPQGTLVQLTNFTQGWVADIEVSYDGQRILFAHCGKGTGKDANPWWHVYEMNADGSGQRQITDGPYHDVQPNYMPDGRIVFSTSRLGTRDEYHGYAATGLAVMNDDGSDIHLIGFNLGRDSEPVVGDDGKILFTRLELFYSRLKTEWNLLTAFPDGTKPVTIYGPERRDFWRSIKGALSVTPPRHRTLRITQPQSWSNSQYLINSFKGPMLTGPGHLKEKILRPNNEWAVTTPYKIDDNTLLVAAGKRPMHPDPESLKSFFKDNYVENGMDIAAAVDHGIYYMDVDSGELTLIYNDPNTAEFEARPLQPRKIPRVLPEGPFTRDRSFTGKILCNSIYTTRIDHVKQRGKYVRIVEGMPTVARHQTHMNGGIAWRNHGGAVGRDLGIVPVAVDGSFSIEVPSDRLFHIQVLDSDRNVVGNELLWQYARPGEVKSCVGCHEKPDVTPVTTRTFPKAHRQKSLKCLPNENDMLHRAKMWTKGWASDEREERMHTVNSINIIGRQ